MQMRQLQEESLQKLVQDEQRQRQIAAYEEAMRNLLASKPRVPHPKASMEEKWKYRMSVADYQVNEYELRNWKRTLFGSAK